MNGYFVSLGHYLSVVGMDLQVIGQYLWVNHKFMGFVSLPLLKKEAVP